MDSVTFTFWILTGTLLVGLWLVKGSGKSHRSRHVRMPMRVWAGLFLSLSGLNISLIAMIIVLTSKHVEGDVGMLVFFAAAHGVIVALTFLGPGVHRRSGFRPWVVVVRLAPGGALTREAVTVELRERLEGQGFLVPRRHPWNCDLVASTDRTFRCNIYQFWNITEAGGEIEARALVDVEDYIITDSRESKEVLKTAEGLAALFDEAPFGPRLLERRIARLPQTNLLLGPGRVTEPAAWEEERPKSLLERFGLYLLHYKLTTPGKFLLAGMVASVSLGAASLRIPVYHLVTALFGLSVVAWVTGLLLRPRVTIAGALPSRTGADHPVTADFTFTNRSFLPAFDVSAGFFHLPPSMRDNRGESWVPMIGPGKSASMPVSLHPVRRGLYTLPDLTAFSTFPFNLFRSSAARERAGNLLVLPDFHPLATIDVPVGRRYQPGGIALTSNVGESPEYIGNREYREGDPIRRIDWKSWARLSRPAVREFQEEYYCRIALVLDTFIPPERSENPEGFADLEAAVSLTAAVADALSQGEFLIDIFAAGPDLHVFRAGRHIAHFENVLEILACLHACRTNPFDRIAPALADQLGNLTTAVCIFLDWDASHERLARSAVEAGCAVKVIVVREGETTEPLDGAERWAESVTSFTPEEVRKGKVEIL